ncbi:ArsS family sensor histidine kinase [Nitratifractor sp.]
MTIRKKISLLFLSSLTVMLSIAAWIEYTGIENNLRLQQERYLRVAKELFLLVSRSKEKQLEQLLDELKFLSLSPKSIPLPQQPYYSQAHSFGSIRLYRIGSKLYLDLRYLDRHLLLYDQFQETMHEERLVTYMLIGLDLFMLIVIFFLIWKMVSPLHRIARKLRRFASGDHQLRLHISNNDEIGEVASSFNLMADRLEAALRSREELLRDVGHELRTPIAKGLFALETLPDSPAKTILQRTYRDLERLTGEILKIQALENERSLQKEKFSVETLVAEALSLLYIENESCLQITIMDSFEIEGDLHYLAIAVKNLIDNALKHRRQPFRPVSVRAVKTQIEICNDGESLGERWQTYLEAFQKQERSREGFGLGLNIVSRVLQLHGFTLRYDYREGQNCFSIDLVNSI